MSDKSKKKAKGVQKVIDDPINSASEEPFGHTPDEAPELSDPPAREGIFVSEQHFRQMVWRKLSDIQESLADLGETLGKLVSPPEPAEEAPGGDADGVTPT